MEARLKIDVIIVYTAVHMNYETSQIPGSNTSDFIFVKTALFSSLVHLFDAQTYNDFRPKQKLETKQNETNLSVIYPWSDSLAVLC